MNKVQENDDVRKLMDENSVKTTVLSYLMTILYGVIAAISAMAGREMLETVAIKLIYGQSLEIVQYGGLKRIAQISAVVIFVLAWMLSFMIVWHRIERAGTLKQRVRVALIWIAGAVVLYALFGVVQYLFVGYWPTLTGAV